MTTHASGLPPWPGHAASKENKQIHDKKKTTTLKHFHSTTRKKKKEEVEGKSLFLNSALLQQPAGCWSWQRWTTTFICSPPLSSSPAPQDKSLPVSHDTMGKKSRWPSVKSATPAPWRTGEDALVESIWTCISWKLCAWFNHAGHPHAKGSKANNSLGIFGNALNRHFYQI